MTADDNVALVTGGARGIGAAIAQGLLDGGARVALLDCDAGALEDGPIDALKIHGDVARPEDCAAAVARTQEVHGGLDILVNNAGIGMGAIRDEHFTSLVRLGDIEPDQWRRMFEVNCMGAFMMTRAALPTMVAKGWGRIINVTTTFFTMMNEGFAPYGPTKAALEAASAIWAKELRDSGVSVNVLVPGGPTDTRFVPASAPFPRSALIPPAAMAAPARWLASRASDDVTGRRFVAGLWDPALPSDQAAERVSAPIAWPDLEMAGRVWPGEPPQ